MSPVEMTKLFLCYHNMLKSMTSLHYNDCLTMGLTWDKMTWFPVGPCSHSGSDSTYLLYTFMYGTPVHTHSQRNGTMILIFFFFFPYCHIFVYTMLNNNTMSGIYQWKWSDCIVIECTSKYISEHKSIILKYCPFSSPSFFLTHRFQNI